MILLLQCCKLEESTQDPFEKAFLKAWKVKFATTTAIVANVQLATMTLFIVIVNSLPGSLPSFFPDF